MEQRFWRLCTVAPEGNPSPRGARGFVCRRCRHPTEQEATGPVCGAGRRPLASLSLGLEQGLGFGPALALYLGRSPVGPNQKEVITWIPSTF